MRAGPVETKLGVGINADIPGPQIHRARGQADLATDLDPLMTGLNPGDLLSAISHNATTVIVNNAHNHRIRPGLGHIRIHYTSYRHA